MFRITRTVCFSATVTLLVAGAGCVNTQKQPKTTAVAPDEFDSQQSKPRVIDMTKAPSSGEYFDVDDCAEKLHDIAGEFLVYFRNKGELPRRLEELAPYALGLTTDYTCPVSHLSYVYVPDGLALAKDVSHGRLILYDAKPVHNSARGPMRWGILFSERRGAKSAPTADVIMITEDVMPGYQPLPPRAPAPNPKAGTQ